jgi:oligosaccharide repeat unit polymerase
VSAPQPLLDVPAPRRTAWLLGLAGGGLVALIGNTPMGAEALVCLTLALLILAPLAYRAWTGTFDLFEPIVLIAGIYMVYFVVGPIVHFAMDDMQFVGRDFQGDYMLALLAAMAGVASVWAGYAMPVGRHRARKSSPNESPARAQRRARRLAWALTGAALLAMALWARVARRSLGFFFLPGVFGGLGSGDQGVDVSYLFLAIEWFMPALAVLMVSNGLRRRFSLLAYFGFVSVVYVSIGFRFRMVVMLLTVGMLFYLRRGTRPKVSVLAASATVGFVFVGWLGWVRTYFRSGGSVGQLDFTLSRLLSNALSDTRIFETFAAVLRTVPEFAPYSGLRPLLYPFILPVPRLLWPDKPAPTWIKDIGGALGTPEAETLGAMVPHFGEYYIAFGWPGLVGGSFLFGMAVKALWRWYQADPSNPWRQALFALHTAFLFQVVIRGYLAQIVQEWCFIILPAIVIIKLARIRPVLVPRGAPSA